MPAKPTGLRRVMHLLSFAFSSMPVMFRQAFWAPDVVLTDLAMPGMDGTAATAALLARHPRVGRRADHGRVGRGAVRGAAGGGAGLPAQGGRPGGARRLVLSEKTVRNHVSNVFSKIQANDRPHAVVLARRLGLGT